jgi:oxaloacetate decarboxylase beta subunit
MIVVGGILIYLAIAKEYEPNPASPNGFGAILVNIPWSSALEIAGAHGIEPGVLKVFFTRVL